MNKYFITMAVLFVIDFAMGFAYGFLYASLGIDFRILMLADVFVSGAFKLMLLLLIPVGIVYLIRRVVFRKEAA